jgi:hypothetical protein
MMDPLVRVETERWGRNDRPSISPGALRADHDGRAARWVFALESAKKIYFVVLARCAPDFWSIENTKPVA